VASEYPKDQQNPPTIPGARPDEQPAPAQRVPDDEPDVEAMTTDERMRHDPKRSDLMTPVKQGDRPQRTSQ
jgi:hypothetical protein